MPFIGAPFVNEGNPDGLLGSIDILASLDSVHQLHGHTPLTTQFSPATMLSKLKPGLAELIKITRDSTRDHKSRQQIQQINFVPDVVLNNAALQIPYMVIRPGIISRLHQQSTGYWQANLNGMDNLTHSDMGLVLSRYLKISVSELDSALIQLLNDGHYDAALKLSSWGLTVHPEDERIQKSRKQALIGLLEKHQFTNPFKFLIYSEAAGVRKPQLAPFSP